MAEELYRGKARFYIGTVGEERVGEIVITDEWVRITGKLSLKPWGTSVLGLAASGIKAVMRATGKGEVDEKISYDEIRKVEISRALKIGRKYVRIETATKKFSILTNDAEYVYQLIFNNVEKVREGSRESTPEGKVEVKVERDVRNYAKVQVGPSFCPMCGIVVEHDWIYCPKCGCGLRW